MLKRERRAIIKHLLWSVAGHCFKNNNGSSPGHEAHNRPQRERNQDPHPRPHGNDLLIGAHVLILAVYFARQSSISFSPLPIAARSRAQSPRVPAIVYYQATPLRNEIEARDPSRLGEATEVAAKSIGDRCGLETVDGKIQAHVVSIQK
jgi:hypothetical protein